MPLTRCKLRARSSSIQSGGVPISSLTPLRIQQPVFPHRLQSPPSTPSSSQGYLSNLLFATMHSRSSSSSTMSDDTKRHLLACLPADSKIIATASARVYHAPFHGHSDDWVYSGLHGTLVFGRNRIAVHADKKLGSGPGTSFDQSSLFRLVDPIKGLVWLHQIPEIFDYSLDKPFFHIFSGKVCWIASIIAVK